MSGRRLWDGANARPQCSWHVDSAAALSLGRLFR